MENWMAFLLGNDRAVFGPPTNDLRNLCVFSMEKPRFVLGDFKAGGCKLARTSVQVVQKTHSCTR